ncbi:hypothetical protein [Streptomyces xanthii]|uniref:Uncharacterized protein n=1 Tax=Streptomyces xanthii TaxID=2768069 RepID=A0A7H1BGV6_9ACTN|nr:hypothetical protein [Streptomyces xanthii]QNS07961.1 hypothetical protein IAG42_33030 [Streptomyces xanthii]
MHDQITVQWVHTVWTKESRGGAAAARRNAAPVGFPLPAGPRSGVHVVRMHEDDGFTPYDTVQEARTVDLRIDAEGGRLRVHPKLPGIGLYTRRRRPPAVRLAPGQWVRWHLNHRFSTALGIRGWTYWLDTFNVAYGPVTEDVFLSAPTVLVDERAWLR